MNSLLSESVSDKIKKWWEDKQVEAIRDAPNEETTEGSKKIAKVFLKGGEPEYAAAAGARYVRGSVQEAIKEHPKTAAALAAALAAGAGALALRKKMKAAAEKK